MTFRPLLLLAITTVALLDVCATAETKRNRVRIRRADDIGSGDGLPKTTEMGRRVQRKGATDSDKKSSKSSKSKSRDDDDDKEEEICDNPDAIFRTCTNGKGSKGKRRRLQGFDTTSSKSSSKGSKSSKGGKSKSSKSGGKRTKRDEFGLFPPEITDDFNLEIGDLALQFIGTDFADRLEDCQCLLNVEEAIISFLSNNFDTDDQRFLCAAGETFASAQGPDGTFVTSLTLALSFELNNDYEDRVESVNSPCTAENLVLCCLQNDLNGQVGEFCNKLECDLDMCSTSFANYRNRRVLQDQNTPSTTLRDNGNFTAVLMRRCSRSSSTTLTDFLHCAVVHDCQGGDGDGDNVNFGLLQAQVVLGVAPSQAGSLAQCGANREDATSDGCQGFLAIDCANQFPDLGLTADDAICTFDDKTDEPTGAPSVVPSVEIDTSAPTTTTTTTTAPSLSSLEPTLRLSQVPSVEPTIFPTLLPTFSPTTLVEEQTPTLRPSSPVSPMLESLSLSMSLKVSLSMPNDDDADDTETAEPTANFASAVPTPFPTAQQVLAAPTFVPTTAATPPPPPTSSEPTVSPTTSEPSSSPTTLAPTLLPTTLAPTSEPSNVETPSPTLPDTFPPTTFPTFAPTLGPNEEEEEEESLSLSMSLSLSLSMVNDATSISFSLFIVSTLEPTTSPTPGGTNPLSLTTGAPTIPEMTDAPTVEMTDTPTTNDMTDAPTSDMTDAPTAEMTDAPTV